MFFGSHKYVALKIWPIQKYFNSKFFGLKNIYSRKNLNDT